MCPAFDKVWVGLALCITGSEGAIYRRLGHCSPTRMADVGMSSEARFVTPLSTSASGAAWESMSLIQSDSASLPRNPITPSWQP